METKNQKGMAMIMTLIFVAVLSAMAVSFMFLSQAETWSTMNYRFMNQARDGAEAGVNVAANHILNTYVLPATAGPDPLGSYTLTTSPVQWGGNDVVLSANSTVPSNYPISAVQSAFSTAGQGSFTSGTATVSYRTAATLLAMRQVTPYGNTCPDGTAAPCTIQMWRIAGEGRILGIRNSEVEIETVLERPIAPTFGFAAFGTSDDCTPVGLQWSGGGSTDSYDSTNIAGGVQAYGGNVGTNGALDMSGASTDINGSLSTPRVGVGSCASGAAASIGSSTLTEGITGLPQTLTYPPPAVPSPLPPLTNETANGNCWGGAPAGCTDVPPAMSGIVNIAPGTYGNLDLRAGVFAHFSAGTYNVNSVQLNGNATLIIDSGPVILNIAGCNTVSGSNCATYLGIAADFSGGSISNPSLVPTNFQVQYAGTGEIRMRGGAEAAALIYAPLAVVDLSGGGDFYGSIIGHSVEVSGGATLHYDRNLQNGLYTIGNFALASFSWKKF